MIVWGVTVALLVAALVLATAIVLIRSAGRLSPIDLPDARRLHQVPTPRGGGLAMPFVVSAAAAIWVLVFAPDRDDVLLCVLGFALPNGLLGVVDDYRPIRSRVKFAIQLGLAVAFVLVGSRLESLTVPPLGAVPLGAASATVTALFLVWSTNVYNFMDGMDGLAAGSGAVFFATLATLGFAAASPDATAGWIAIFGGAACMGFLSVNRPPARIFMGDGGALFIGALLGGLAVVLARSDGAAAPTAALTLAMGSFLWDATYTLVMRMVRREKWNLPHKRHLFQRLVTAGWSHGHVRAVYAFLALVGSVGAIATAFGGTAAAATGLSLALLAFVALSVVTERVEARSSSPAPPA